MSDKTNYYLILSLLLFIIFNLIILDLNSFKTNPVESITTAVAETSPTPSSINCPQSCIDLITAPTVNQTILPVSTSNPINISGYSKEYYIPIGSGITKKSDYDFISSAEVTIDSRNYPGIKEVWFEVFMHIPTGNGIMYVKLFNSTDGHDVWFSETSTTGSDIVKRAVKISLDSGNKTYRVMVKSSMGYEAVVDQARLKIVLN